MADPHAMAPPAGTRSDRPFAIPCLDGMRAVGFLSVFANHAGYHVLPGRMFLQMFFVVSGYLITTLLRREWELHGRVSLRAYYLRRVLRIFPGLYVALGLALLLSVTHVLKDPFTWGGFAASAFHLTNYWTAYGHRDDLILAVGPYWSLAVEEHFYLLFPLVLLGLLHRRVGRRAMGRLFAAVAVVVLVYRSWISFTFPAAIVFDRAYYPTEVCLDAILWGCVLALVVNPALDVVRGSRRAWVGGALPVAVLALVLSVLGPRAWQQSGGYTLQALAFAAIIVALVKFPDTPLARFLQWRPVAFLGVLSYAMYLLHRIAIFAVNNNLDLPSPVRASLAFAATFAGALLMYRFVEQPCDRWRRRLARAGEAETPADRRRGTTAVPTT